MNWWNTAIRRVDLSGWSRLCPELNSVAPIRDNHPRNLVVFAGLVGWIFVIAGVAGEGIGEHFVADGDTNLRAFNNALLADTQQSANSAAAAASLANFFVDKAQQKENALETKYRRIIWEGPRYVLLSEESAEKKFNGLNRFAGQKFRFSICEEDPRGPYSEFMRAKMVLYTLLHEATWNPIFVGGGDLGQDNKWYPNWFVVTCAIGLELIRDGISVNTSPNASDSTRKAAAALQSVANDVLLDNVRVSRDIDILWRIPLDADTLDVHIGAHPATPAKKSEKQ